jgi:hypothetical protein
VATRRRMLLSRGGNLYTRLVLGMRGLPNKGIAYRRMLPTVSEVPDRSLLSGLSGDELFREMDSLGYQNVALKDLLRSLAAMDELQVEMGVKPPVFAYHEHTQKLYISDRSFLFFRKYGAPRWPWDEDDFDLDVELPQQTSSDEG